MNGSVASSPAGLRLRSLAFGFDYLPIAGYLVVLVGAGAALTRLAPRVAVALFGAPLRGEVAGFVLVTSPVLLYFALSEASSRQATWGKRRLGLTVADSEGRRLTLRRSLARSALKLAPWELAHACIWQITYSDHPSSPAYAGGFGLVWLAVGANAVALLVSPTRRTFYDRLAGTAVRETPIGAELYHSDSRLTNTGGARRGGCSGTDRAARRGGSGWQASSMA
ncbi:MAG: RDD family protein [Actinobacteria bacterium]|nr:RDD family protein [Actinomycetota bacterium]